MGAACDRQKRVQRLKKIILGFIAGAVLVPFIFSIILGIRVVQLHNRVKELEALLEEAESNEGRSVYSVSAIEESPRDDENGKRTLAEDAGAVEENTVRKEIYLTFDDGPSRSTSKILDILKEYGVKATFFVVGRTDDNSVALYKRIVEEGHTLAMHSYSHKYDEIYQSKESFAADLSKLQEFLYDTTGVWCRYCRFPGGSSNTVSRVDMHVLIDYLEEQDMSYYDWNIVSGDASSSYISPEAIVRNSTANLRNFEEAVILMHDASDKDSTVKALPTLIEQIQAMEDTKILPITDETEAIHHISND